MMAKLTKEDFVNRCGAAYDAGLVDSDTLELLKLWLNFVIQFEGGNMDYVSKFMVDERSRTDMYIHTLSTDLLGARAVQLSYLLSHRCQACATNPHAWWSKDGSCDHVARKVCACVFSQTCAFCKEGL